MSDENRDPFNPLCLGALAFAMVTFCCGFLLAMLSFRVELQLDYNSGDQRVVSFLGPLRVREEDKPTPFGRTTMNNEQRGLTERPNWQTAAEFYGNSKRSPSFEAGRVLYSIAELEARFFNPRRNDVSEIKLRFLEALASGGSDEAIERNRELLHRSITNGEFPSATGLSKN
jgi:hypothetical protein